MSTAIGTPCSPPVPASFMVLILLWRNTGLFAGSAPFVLNFDEWSELVTWACLLVIPPYAMETLYDRTERHLAELRQTYFGLLTILQQFISNDKYTHNRSYRVALYASSIATRMGFTQDCIDDVRAAALLHDRSLASVRHRTYITFGYCDTARLINPDY